MIFSRKRITKSTHYSIQHHVEIHHPDEKDNWEQCVVDKEPKWSVHGAKEWKRIQANIRDGGDDGDDDDDDEGEDVGEEGEQEGEQEEEEEGEKARDQMEVGKPHREFTVTAFDNAVLASDYGSDLALLAGRWRDHPDDEAAMSKYKLAKADFLDLKYRTLLREAREIIEEVEEARKVCRVVGGVLGRIAAERGLSQQQLMTKYGASEEEVEALDVFAAVDDDGS